MILVTLLCNLRLHVEWLLGNLLNVPCLNLWLPFCRGPCDWPRSPKPKATTFGVAAKGHYASNAACPDSTEILHALWHVVSVSDKGGKEGNLGISLISGGQILACFTRDRK